MIKELLKKLGYSDEDITKIENGIKEEKIYLTKEEKIEERYEKLKVKKEALQDELKEANTTIADLKKNNSGNEDLQKKVSEYEKTIDTLKKDGEKKSFDMALELELTRANAKKTKAVKALLDLEKVKLKDDGSFDGLNEQLDKLKESDDYLFNTGTVKAKYNPQAGDTPLTGDLATLMKNKDFNLTEYLSKEK